MKTKFYFLLIALFAFTFSAGAQRFGNDIVIHECDGSYWAKPKISVADNGWIYVLVNKYGSNQANDETRIYRSTDGGATFSQIMHGITPSDKTQGGRDIVVTGDNPSNMILWYVYADNNTSTGAAYVYLIKMDADGNNWTTAYSYNYANTVNHDVAISTNARSPEGVWSPFTIAFAASSNYYNKGYIDYIYSTDGGTTFNSKAMYSKDNSTFGLIDLSIGQADESYYYPRAGIVFEMDKGSESNIGFIAAFADGDDATDVLKVNKKFSATNETKQPKIQWLCNNTLDEPYNFMIIYSNYCDEEEWDVMKIYPTDDYSLYDHTLDNLGWKYAAAYYGSDEDYADLSYDKQYNNYLLVYRKSSGNDYTLQYKVESYTDLVSNSWTIVDNVSSTSSGSDRYYSSVVDIDPTRTQACFAFERYNWAPTPTVTQLLFDSEWSTVDVEEVVVNGELKVFPNPATDNVTLRMNEEGTYLVRMYNMLGAEVAAFEFTGTEINHDISTFPAGMYFIKLNTEKGTEFNAKIIVR